MVVVEGLLILGEAVPQSRYLGVAGERDDKDPIYRLTIGYLRFIYVCCECVQENKQ